MKRNLYVVSVEYVGDNIALYLVTSTDEKGARVEALSRFFGEHGDVIVNNIEVLKIRKYSLLTILEELGLSVAELRAISGDDVKIKRTSS